MKKIGILFGMENTFPGAFVERVNAMKVDGVVAEAVSIDKVVQGAATEYAVIIDRISQDVPFYRAFLKNAAISGTAVINNPFWWSADEKFFNNALALSVGVPVPNTVLLPSKERPTDTQATSFRNLKFPLDWEGIFNYVGFPAFMKPHAGGGWKNVYKLDNLDDFHRAYDETGQLVMMLQEAIDFTEYFRCYCLGGKYVHIMQYEPRNPHHLRYVRDGQPVAQQLLDTIKDYVLRLNQALGYDFNTVEFAVRDGVPIAIDFCNPAPDAEYNSVGGDNFEWVVEHAAKMAIEKALAHKDGQMNLTWGSFVRQAVAGEGIHYAAPVAEAPKAAAPKAAAKPAEAPAPSIDPAAAQSQLMAAIGVADADQKDDLKKIKGVGPKLEKTLNSMGIFTYAQVSKMGSPEYALLDSLLNAFQGRAERDDWAGQAKNLMG